MLAELALVVFFLMQRTKMVGRMLALSDSCPLPLQPRWWELGAA